jgi:hypothetical protein
MLKLPGEDVFRCRSLCSVSYFEIGVMSLRGLGCLRWQTKVTGGEIFVAGVARAVRWVSAWICRSGSQKDISCQSGLPVLLY